MKTTLLIIAGLALGATLLGAQTLGQPGTKSETKPASQCGMGSGMEANMQSGMHGKMQSCCGGGDMLMQHSDQQTDKPVVAKLVKGVQVATVTVDRGYTPSAIQVKKGTPVELTFKGGKNIGCGGTVVFKSLKISKDVATGKSTAIKFTPKDAGEIPFTCGMGMMKGKVIVK